MNIPGLCSPLLSGGITGAAPSLAPLYDVSSVLPWPHVVQSYAQSIAGKKRTPDMIAGRHWEKVARDIGYRPTDVRNRVQELVDKLVACRVKVTAEVARQAEVFRNWAIAERTNPLAPPAFG